MNEAISILPKLIIFKASKYTAMWIDFNQMWNAHNAVSKVYCVIKKEILLWNKFQTKKYINVAYLYVINVSDFQS